MLANSVFTKVGVEGLHFDRINARERNIRPPRLCVLLIPSFPVTNGLGVKGLAPVILDEPIEPITKREVVGDLVSYRASVFAKRAQKLQPFLLGAEHPRDALLGAVGLSQAVLNPPLSGEFSALDFSA